MGVTLVALNPTLNKYQMLYFNVLHVSLPIMERHYMIVNMKIGYISYDKKYRYFQERIEKIIEKTNIVLVN